MTFSESSTLSLATDKEKEKEIDHLNSRIKDLQTSNRELILINEVLRQSNSDLNNLIQSTSIGIVYLDESLLVRNFSPASKQFFNIIDSDIGKPFLEVPHELMYEDLSLDIVKVHDYGESIEKEIITKQGNNIVITISRYITSDFINKGLVVSLTDVTKVRHLEGVVNKSYSELRTTLSKSLSQNQQDFHILLIDDSISDRALVLRHLKKIEHWNVYLDEAEHLSEAIDKIDKNSYDIILIDFKLDNKTAFDLLSELSEQTLKAAPIILLSGFLREDMNSKALDLGIYDCIDKEDLSSALLERCVRYAICNHRLDFYLNTDTKIDQ